MEFYNFLGIQEKQRKRGRNQREEGLIKREYREHCQKVYKKIGVRDEKLLKLIMVRNYIAGMTDAFATDQHAILFMPSEHIRF